MNAKHALFAMLLLALAAPATALDRAAMREGMRLYKSGEYEAAAGAFERAGDDPRALFNRACALQRLGEHDEAQRLLQEVDAVTRRENLAQSTRYNLGATAIEQARALADAGEQTQALDAYRRAARFYRDAHAMNPADTDAARNTELAGREAKKLLDRIRAREQAMQQMADQLEDLQQQQRQEAEQNQEQDQQQAQPQQGQEQQDGLQQPGQQGQRSENQSAAERQREISEQTQATRDQMRDLQQRLEQSRQGSTAAPQQDDPLERAAENLDRAADNQRQAEEKLQRGDQEKAAQSQRRAAEDLRRAASELAGERQDPEESPRPGNEQTDQQDAESGEQAESNPEQEEDQDPRDQQSAQQQSEQQGEGESRQASQSDGGSGASGDETADPLDALADELLEKEERDRERLERIRSRHRSRNEPVEKDW